MTNIADDHASLILPVGVPCLEPEPAHGAMLMVPSVLNEVVLGWVEGLATVLLFFPMAVPQVARYQSRARGERSLGEGQIVYGAKRDLIVLVRPAVGGGIKAGSWHCCCLTDCA